MAWLSAHGVAQTYREYMALPLDVLSDCRVMMEGEWMRAALDNASGARKPTQDLMEKDREEEARREREAV